MKFFLSGHSIVGKIRHKFESLCLLLNYQLVSTEKGLLSINSGFLVGRMRFFFLKKKEGPTLAVKEL